MQDLWRELYSTADRLYALAPWQWIGGSERFGVQDPITGEIGFINVMGQAGDHLGISRYPGEEGLRVLQALQESDLTDPQSGSEILLNSAQLQVSWEDRDILEEQDKKLIKNLGLKYRGPQAWPHFRSYEPSLYPWFLTKEQAATLLIALDQSFEVFQRRQNDPALLTGLKKDHYLVRVSSNGVWQDEIKKVLPAVEKFSVISQIPSLSQLKAVGGRKGCVEIDLILSPAVKCVDLGDRPIFPYLLMMIDASSGMILSGVEFLQPIPSLDAMYGQVAEKVCASLLKAKFIPAEIRVRRKVMEGILAPLVNELGLRVTFQKRLPGVDEASQAMASFFNTH
jgi:hypothetical protein